MVTHATLAMTVARSATADVVRVGCIRSGPGDANASGISVVAIRVGSVTDL